MKKVICVVCLAFFALAGNAQDFKGTWVLDEASKQAPAIMKRMSVVAQNSSKLVSETPITMVFEEGIFTFTYSDGSIIKGGYYMVDKTLMLGSPDVSSEFKVIEQNGQLSIEIANNEKASFNKAE